MTDAELLHAYAENRSDDAFAALIDRYVRLVFSACLRQLSDRHLAEDATQGVFVLLSQKAGKIPSTRLAGWLLTTARYACANIRRTQMRRQQREQVVAMNQDHKPADDNTELLAMLDDALCHLRKTDREALVLRYLKEQPLQEVGQALGISEEAARKRVSRGMDKLRQYFSRKGLMTNATALSAILAEQAQGAALTPAAHELIKQGVLHAAHAGAASTAVGAVVAKGVNMTILTTKLKIAAALVAIAAALIGSGWLISQIVSDKPPQPVAAAPISLAPQPIPSSGVVLDLSTPEKSLDSLSRALVAGDREKFYACTTADPNRPPTMIDALVTLSLTQNELIHAVNLVFGNGERARHSGTPDQILRIIMSTWSKNAQVAKIQGDTASIPLEAPPMLLQLLPQQTQEGVKLWLGRPIPFDRINGQWRVDIDNIGRIVGTLDGRNIQIADRARVTAALTGEAKLQTRLAEKIIDHKFRTWEQADAQWERDRRLLRSAQGYRVLNFSFFPVAPSGVIPDIQGDWEGTMDLFGTGVADGASTKTRIVLKLTSINGGYQATADFIEMGRKDVTIHKVIYDYPTVHLIMNPRTSYDLTINADATEMFCNIASFQGQNSEIVLKHTTTPDSVPQRLAENDFAAQKDSDLQGYWKGTIGDGSEALPVDLKIAGQSDGTFRAELDNPMLGANAQPVSVMYSRPTVKLLVATGSGMFRGEINEDATEITGSWIQGGKSKPVTFKRADFQAEHAHDAERDYSYTSSTDLQGHWKGSWNFIDTKIRLALDIAKLPDGSLSAALTNIDQFGSDDPVPTSNFQYSPSDVHMEWKWTGGAFEGRLKNGKLIGSWKQGGASFPLVFLRAAAN